MASAPRLTLYHVHGFRSSRVFWLARELQRSYGIADTGGGTRKHPRFGIPELKILEFADADAFRAEKPAALLALNPNGKVPAALLEHPAPAGGGAAPPDVALFESGAIASFYLDTYDTEHLLLPPPGTNERAVFNVLSHWCTGTIDNLTSNSSPIQRALADPAAGRSDDVARRANATYAAHVFAPWLAAQLGLGLGGGDGGGEDRYICGPTFTAADVMVGHSFSHSRLLDFLRDPETEAEAAVVACVEDYAKLLRSRRDFQEVYYRSDEEE